MGFIWLNCCGMKSTKTPFEGLLLIEPKKMVDKRGAFYEGFHARSFGVLLPSMRVAQVNYNSSRQYVLRGLHFQCPPAAQAKLVHVTEGKIMDVVVDLRRRAATYGKHYRLCLEARKPLFLYIPKGFAHGFLVLSRRARVEYLCDAHYSPSHERGIRYDDKTLGIEWGVDEKKIILSEKDKRWGDFSSCGDFFS